jgi:hypothetical protein
VGLEQGSLSLVSTIEELLGRKYSSYGLEIAGVGIFIADHVTPLFLEKLTPASLRSGGRSVGVIRSRTKATELLRYYYYYYYYYCSYIIVPQRS